MSQADALERQMLELINAERALVGAGALQLELNLNEAAEDHSLWMIAVDAFSHTGDGGSNPGARMAGAGFDFSGSYGWAENIAGRTISSPASGATIVAPRTLSLPGVVSTLMKPCASPSAMARSRSERS